MRHGPAGPECVLVLEACAFCSVSCSHAHVAGRVVIFWFLLCWPWALDSTKFVAVVILLCSMGLNNCVLRSGVKLNCDSIVCGNPVLTKVC